MSGCFLLQHPQEDVGRDDGHAFKRMEHPQILVSADDDAGLARQGYFQELVVLGIAASGDPLHPCDLLAPQHQEA